jgi:hypothetical protein
VLKVIRRVLGGTVGIAVAAITIIAIYIFMAMFLVDFADI